MSCPSGGYRLFGYITPMKPDLRVRDLESYKAVYCGLCRQLGSAFGPAARLTLSYDFAFLAILRYAVDPDSAPGFEPGYCRCKLRRVPLVKPDETLAFAADTALLMLYYKLEDNILDAAGPGCLGWRALRPLIAGAHKKAAARRPGSEALIAACMSEQRAVEASPDTGVDAACEPTAKAMAGIFESLSGDTRQRRVLARAGYLTGRFIYLCDALDDLPADLKKGGYNPLAGRFSLGRGAGSAAIAGAAAFGRDALLLTAGEAARAFALLETHRFAPLLENIYYHGLSCRVGQILHKRYPDLPPGPADDSVTEL